MDASFHAVGIMVKPDPADIGQLQGGFKRRVAASIRKGDQQFYAVVLLGDLLAVKVQVTVTEIAVGTGYFNRSPAVIAFQETFRLAGISIVISDLQSEGGLVIQLYYGG